jgi:hypothetical protein
LKNEKSGNFFARPSEFAKLEGERRAIRNKSELWVNIKASRSAASGTSLAAENPRLQGLRALVSQS